MRLLLAALLMLGASSAASAQRNGAMRPATRAPTMDTAPNDALTRRVLSNEMDSADRALDRAARRMAADGYDLQDVLAAYQRDRAGRWYRRGEIVITARDGAPFDTAEQMGLTEQRRATLAAAGVVITTFITPADADSAAAVAALREAHPEAGVDLNYVYVVQGDEAPAPHSSYAPTAAAHPGAATIAIIDGPIAEAAFEGVELESRRFTPTTPSSTAHASAVAAILLQTANVAEVRLLAADVINNGPITGASADAIARALDWAAQRGAGVINISLTGPPSMALAMIADALLARGCVIVAAAGNDGPRADAPYPAALSGVIGVTAVDARGRVWRRATRGEHVDFAALGVNVDLGARRRVTGTSYAAPIVAGLLARNLPAPDPNAARNAQTRLSATAHDLGAPGRDTTFGFGLVSAD